MYVYDQGAKKRPVNLSLNEDLVRRVREVSPNLSEEVERLLAGHLEQVLVEHAAEGDRMKRALEGWNELLAREGSYADDHSTL